MKIRDKYNSIFSEIIEKCLALEKIGYFLGTWGNVSVRVEEGLIVTPSKMAYASMTNNDFVILSFDGRVLDGDKVPTSEANIHRLLYNKRNDINAIIHNHSLYATAMSCLHKPIPPFVEELSQLVGGRINCTKYIPAGQHMKIAEEAANTIGTANSLLLANHGVIGCGQNLEEAFLVCRAVEKAACMLLAAGSTGRVKSIPDKFVKSERHRFLYKYGTKADK